MKKETILIVIGVLTSLMSFVGIPGEWKMYAYFIFGGGVIIIGLLLKYQKHSPSVSSEEANDVYGETQNTIVHRNHEEKDI